MKREEPDILLNACFAGMLLLLALDRLLMLVQFSSRWIDDDQGVLWVVTDELLKGRFHQIHFPGQSYNIVLEPFLATPLVGAGMPPAFALPLVTLLLAVFPFVFFASLFWRKGRKTGVLLSLVYLLTLPLSYSFVSSLPRGFMGGIAVAAVSAALLIFDPAGRRGTFLGGFLAVLSCSINPNAFLLLGPVVLVRAVDPAAAKASSAVSLAAGIGLGGAVHYLTRLQYILNPDLDRYKLKGLEPDFTAAALGRGFEKLDSFFGMYSPFGVTSPGGCFLVIALCVLYCLVRKEWKVPVLFVSALAVCAVSFTLRKIYDGSESLFYPFARPFLAVPPVIALGLQMLPLPALSRKREKFIALTCFAAGVLSVLIHIFSFDEFAAGLRTTRPWAVTPERVSAVKAKCEELLRTARQQNAEIAVFVPGGGNPARLLGYLCPVMLPDFPPTLITSLERRRWRVREEHGKQRFRFFFFNPPSGFESRASAAEAIGIKTEKSAGGFLVVSEQGIPVRKLVKILVPLKNKKKAKPPE